MGLDMYLEARKYVTRVDWAKVPRRKEGDPPINPKDYLTPDYERLTEFFPAELIKHSESGSHVAINIGYWRKANQIHGWFVDNVQGGEDNCQEYLVERSNLEELLELVTEVLDSNRENSFVAKERLPVRGGFFFGNYDEDEGYDEWYYEQLEYTKTLLTDILNAIPENEHKYDIYYSSSW